MIRPLLVLAVVIGALAGLPASARAGAHETRAEGTEQERALRVVHLEVVRSIKALSGPAHPDPDEELAAIERHQRVLDAARAEPLPHLPLTSAERRALDDNLEHLARALARARAAHACSMARLAVLRRHQRNAPASEGELQRLRAAIADLEAAGGAPAEVAWLVGELARFEAEAERLRDPPPAERAAFVATAGERLLEAGGRANHALEEARATVGRGALPTVEQLARLRAARDEVAALDEDAALFYSTELFHLERHRSWRAGGGEAARLLAAHFGGERVAEGNVHDGRLRLELSVAPEHCYLLLRKPLDDLPVDAPDEVRWTIPGDGLQRFTHRWGDDLGVLPIEGFCATQAGVASGVGDLAVPGPTGTLRYAVIALPRAAFPPLLAAHVELRFDDRCHLGWWASLWEHPVPGTLAWLDGEPVLVTSSDRAGGDRLARYINVAGKLGAAKKSALSSDPPTSWGAVPPFEGWACPRREAARSAHSRALDRCLTDVEQRYQTAWDSLDEARRTASAPRDDLDTQALRLAADAERELEERCRAPREAMLRDAEATYRVVLTHLRSELPADPARRAEHGVREEEAPFRRW